MEYNLSIKVTLSDISQRAEWEQIFDVMAEGKVGAALEEAVEKLGPCALAALEKLQNIFPLEYFAIQDSRMRTKKIEFTLLTASDGMEFLEAFMEFLAQCGINEATGEAIDDEEGYGLRAQLKNKEVTTEGIDPEYDE